LIHLAALAAPATGFNLVAFTNQLLALALLEFATDWIGVGYYFWSNAIINLAHGEFIMLGAYTTFVLQSNFSLVGARSPLAAIIGAITVTVIRRLYGRPLETLLAT